MVDLSHFSKKPESNPAKLGNVQLQVTGYSKTGDTFDGVHGVVLNPKDGAPSEMTIRLMSADRAHNIFKGKDGVAHWEERFAKRPGVSEYVEGRWAVPVGGVVSMQDVRRDYSDNQYYAMRMYSMITKPMEETIHAGHIDFKHFSGDGPGHLKVNLFEPGKAFRLSRDNEKRLDRAFELKGYGEAEVARQALVTIRGGDRTVSYVLRSAAVEAEKGRFSLTNGIRETLSRLEIMKDGAVLGAAAAAAALGMSMSEININVDLSKDQIDVVNQVVEGIVNGDVEATITPGMQVQTYNDRIDYLVKKSRMLGHEQESGYESKGSTPGTLVLRHKLASDPKVTMDRALMSQFQADNNLPYQAEHKEGFMTYQQVGQMAFESVFDLPEAEQKVVASANQEFGVSPDMAPDFN